jgi:hypothetical protein
MTLPPLLELELRALGVLERVKPKAKEPKREPVKQELYDAATGEYSF